MDYENISASEEFNLDFTCCVFDIFFANPNPAKEISFTPNYRCNFSKYCQCLLHPKSSGIQTNKHIANVKQMHKNNSVYLHKRGK